MRSDINAAEFLLCGKPHDRIALRLLDGDVTYGQLDDASKEFASRLIHRGGRKGDRVALLSGNSSPWVVAYLGTLRAGMVCIPLSSSISEPDLAYVLESTGPRVAFVQRQLCDKHGPVISSYGISVIPDAAGEWNSCFCNTSKDVSASNLLDVRSDDLAALMFTSGSTGRPRGVMVSHNNIVANTTSIIEALRLRESDRIMAVLPFHYCFGTSLLHTYLRVGASLVIDTRFTFPERILDRMAQAECTSFAGVPSHYQILLRNSSFRKRSFPHLHSLLQAGGHLAPTFVRELRELLPQTQIFIMYGQTEATARLAYLPPEYLASKPGSIGKAIPGVKLHLLKETDEEADIGEIGEIVAQGENITQGYWHSPDETAASFRNGRLHTGDLAIQDEDGFFYIVDRAKEFVKCGGTRISCRQIEDRLMEYDELLEAAVVGVPDEILGEAVRAFVVPRNAAHEGLEGRLQSFCKASLPRQIIPREFVVVEKLPKSNAGKVLRSQLRNWEQRITAPLAS